ncbi:hypothetical protein SAMN05444413_103179 [Roseivivax marinus]|nr:hypothetical protein SAMN05444413_103179 [Roseivivax marinus]
MTQDTEDPAVPQVAREHAWVSEVLADLETYARRNGLRDAVPDIRALRRRIEALTTDA